MDGWSDSGGNTNVLIVARFFFASNRRDIEESKWVCGSAAENSRFMSIGALATRLMSESAHITNGKTRGVDR
ncbi:hypothetical protein [Rosistilla oblonga]|uniref:hypothetical protein n=1 Tax=Rosistilla oblonga TaxID=2527990 RepID=UPI003A97D249